jgi:hypothetical protein
LEALEKGEFDVPVYEEQMRSLLFAKCLEIMRRRKFKKPYEIFAEDREISKEARPDITLGRLEKDDKFVAIELKACPLSLQEITADVKKLQGFVKESSSLGLFAMIGKSRKKYREYLNMKELGIQQEICESDEAETEFKREGETSFYQWKLVKVPAAQSPLETLLVGILS